ncbi:unnamed protein product [Laminaria digitata]
MDDSVELTDLFSGVATSGQAQGCLEPPCFHTLNERVRGIEVVCGERAEAKRHYAGGRVSKIAPLLEGEGKDSKQSSAYFSFFLNSGTLTYMRTRVHSTLSIDSDHSVCL